MLIDRHGVKLQVIDSMKAKKIMEATRNNGKDILNLFFYS